MIGTHTPVGTPAPRVVGTGYEGKEPFRYTTDVLHEITRRTGDDLGFEAALTSRVFTVRAGSAELAGVILPGRGDATGAQRAATDLDDGLAALARAGYRATRQASVSAAPVGGVAAVVAGPLPVPSRWASTADRLVLGEVWRHVVVEEWIDDRHALCFDPTVGGYTAIPRADLDRPEVDAYAVAEPDTPTDPTVLARHCLAEGARWRASGTNDDRDEHGLRRLAARARDLVAASGGRRRLRMSLAAYAIDTMRATALLGFCGPLRIGQIALAEVLADVSGAATDAQNAIQDGNTDRLHEALLRLAKAGAAATELYRREARTA